MKLKFNKEDTEYIASLGFITFFAIIGWSLFGIYLINSFLAIFLAFFPTMATISIFGKDYLYELTFMGKYFEKELEKRYHQFKSSGNSVSYFENPLIQLAMSDKIYNLPIQEDYVYSIRTIRDPNQRSEIPLPNYPYIGDFSDNRGGDFSDGGGA